MDSIISRGNMMQEYYVKAVRAISQKRRRGRAKIATKEQAEKLVGSVRRKIFRCFGSLPRRTPLNPVTTGTIQRDTYRIEKVIFHSRPAFPVTANLYVPMNINGKCPAVIGSCGHAPEGKACVPYQSFCHSLARNGFVVLIYDPISQGERMQYLGETHPCAPTGLCHEHNMLGNSMQLAGEFFGTWRAWDGIRALDYLLTRPEVDATRIGITGNSGGGTLTSYINSLDERFTMAAPSCFVTTYVHNIENEEPQDSEQIPPRFLGLGLDVADFFIARAPRPVMLLGQKNDFFDPRGLLETYGEVRKIYSLLGAENNVEYFIGPDGHGYHRKNREAMHRFFSKHSGMRLIENEGDIKLEDRTNLQCTDRGQVNLSMKNCRKVFEFTQQKAESLRVSRKTKTKAELESAVRSLLNIKPVDATPMYRKLKPTDNPDFFISRFAVETEPEIQAILFSLSSKQKSGAPRLFLDAGISANLYVPHLSSREDINNGEFDFTAGDRDAYALDPRGGGESTPLSCGMQDFFSPYDSDYFYACIGNMLGSPYLGGKVFDILQTLRLLKDNGYSDIHLIGRGLGSITCAFAAFLSGDVKKVTLKNALTSYHELAMCPSYKWPLSHMIHGVLKHFDLPDIYACLDEKNIAIIDPWDEKMEKKQEAN